MSTPSDLSQHLHKIVSACLVAAVLGLGKFYVDTKTEMAILKLKVETIQEQQKTNRDMSAQILSHLKEIVD